MENIPRIRIVGRASTEKKMEVEKRFKDSLFRQLDSISQEKREIITSAEHKKSKTEVALIDFANRETSRLMQEAGIEPYDIPIDNYHILPDDYYVKLLGKKSSGEAFHNKQAILLNKKDFEDNPVNFGAVALHETLHLKAHFSMEVREDDGKISETPYREGVGIKALQRYGLHGQYYEHFRGLHEAIVSETEKRLLSKLLDCPELSKEKEWLESDEAKSKKKKLAERKGITEDEIIWVGTNEKDWDTIPYLSQRNVLDYICSEVVKQFPDQYKNSDEVYKEFLNANFTGRLLTIARLVEKTFGEGSFRLLGNMDDSKKSGVAHLESFKKARARQIKT